MKKDLIAIIDDVLPQTQCTRCGYPSCNEYAKAVVDNTAEINQCPPGGDEGIIKLAQIMNKPVMALNPENGEIKPRKIVYIDEDVCIGCTLCIKACPVDAIIGANKMMHTVVADECSGCDLCIPACPVDCIHLIDDAKEWTDERKWRARGRFDQIQERRNLEKLAREKRLQEQTELLKKVKQSSSVETKEALPNDFIAQIMARAKSEG
ncbi:MAG: RnfABCDGE type electron transport complex subunit B [Burkholderiales bacterium]|nr:RnfABCDGE type electron transport complex subunit B [Burkholderiales bacterium]